MISQKTTPWHNLSQYRHHHIVRYIHQQNSQQSFTPTSVHSSLSIFTRIILAWETDLACTHRLTICWCTFPNFSLGSHYESACGIFCIILNIQTFLGKRRQVQTSRLERAMLLRDKRHSEGQRYVYEMSRKGIWRSHDNKEQNFLVVFWCVFEAVHERFVS